MKTLHHDIASCTDLFIRLNKALMKMRLYKNGSDMILFCTDDLYSSTFHIPTPVTLMTHTLCPVTQRHAEELNHPPAKPKLLLRFHPQQKRKSK